MACHTGEGDSGSSKVKHVAQHVIPALPLRPVKRRPAPNKAHDAAPVENGPEHGTSERLPSGGQDTPDRALKVQFGELERDHEQAVYYSLPSFENTSSSTPSTLPSGMFALGQYGILNSEIVTRCIKQRHLNTSHLVSD